MNQPMFESVFKRLLKGFIAGGIASTATLLTAGVTITNVDDLKKFAIGLVAAFAAGGLLAIEKALNWKDPEEQSKQEKLQNFLNQ